jgi:hypothetical protein
MEVAKEITQILKEKNSIKNICENLEFQKKEISKKLYFLRVIDLTQQIDEMIENKKFEHNHVEHIKFFIGYDEDIGNKIYMKFYDREDDDISSYVDEELQSISDFMSKFNGFNVEDTGTVFNSLYGSSTIKLNKHYKKKLLDAFFSEELKLILDTTINYINLKNDLHQPETGTNKRLKV